MNLTPPIIAVLIAAFSLLVSLLSFVMHRRDKGAERMQAAIKEQKDQLTLVDTTVHRRIDDLTTTTSGWQAQNVVRLTAIDTEQAQVQERLKHILDRRDLEVLQRSISDVAVSVGRLSGQLDTNTRMTERINNFLMEQGK